MNDLPRPSFGERLLAAFLAFMRMLAKAVLIVLLLGLLAGAAYFGIPYLYRTYIQPMEETQAALTTLETQTSQRLEDLSTRVNQLEANNAQLQGRIDALEEQQSRTQAALEALQTVVDEQGQALTTLDDLQKQLDALDARLKDLDTALTSVQENTQALQGQLEASQLAVKPLFLYLRLLQSMEHLTRARLFLSQANYGLATDEIRAAQTALGDLAVQVTPEQADAVREVVDRLQRAQKRLPQRPVLAAEEMDIAWRLLNDLLPLLTTPPGTLSPTPAAENTPTPTPTPTPNP